MDMALSLFTDSKVLAGVQVKCIAWPAEAMPEVILPGPVKTKRRMLEKVWEYWEAMHDVWTDLKPEIQDREP